VFLLPPETPIFPSRENFDVGISIRFTAGGVRGSEGQGFLPVLCFAVHVMRLLCSFLFLTSPALWEGPDFDNFQLTLQRLLSDLRPLSPSPRSVSWVVPSLSTPGVQPLSDPSLFLYSRDFQAPLPLGSEDLPRVSSVRALKEHKRIPDFSRCVFQKDELILCSADLRLHSQGVVHKPTINLYPPHVKPKLAGLLWVTEPPLPYQSSLTFSTSFLRKHNAGERTLEAGPLKSLPPERGPRRAP